MIYVDTTKAVTHIGLCAGYGGIELGLKRVITNLRSVALCEIEAFAIANLVAKMEAGLMDPAPVWPDLKTFPWGAFRDRVDILTGGYPCQPFSAAGKRAGKDDPRHLWPYIADGIRLLRPRLCFFENVEGHITLGLSDVVEDLVGMGYRTTWGLFSAAEVGAPHQRKRVFILAHRNDAGLEGWHSQVLRQRASELLVGPSCSCWPSRPGEQQYGWEPPRVVGSRLANPDQLRLEEHGLQHAGVSIGSGGGQDAEAVANTGIINWERGSSRIGRRARSQVDDSSRNEDQRQTESPLGGDVDGASRGVDDAELYVSGDNRTDELRLLGNGVVPTTAEKAFRTLINEMKNQKKATP